MLTYDLSKEKGPIYQKLYELIKQDICDGGLPSGQKMPSKRSFAKNMGVSTITVENAYDLLMSEGYLYSIPKKGYYVSKLDNVFLNRSSMETNLEIDAPKKEKDYFFDFSSNKILEGNFPFSTWTKLMREVMSVREKDLLKESPCGGVLELRRAIANHLSSFRGMNVDPNQIIVGAGTEYLYGMLIKLLGTEKLYGVENPGYRKILQVYESNGVTCELIDMDDYGVKVSPIRECKVDVMHLRPNHHFPTGITMSLSRRYDLLNWVKESPPRYIIEDDYDSEFRLKGKPIPTLFGMDCGDKVIYMNTFSKSLTSTIRISYMVLPKQLANEYYKKLGFYSCTVSTFEQYTLASFIAGGYFEKHINRMRLKYGRKRANVLGIIRECLGEEQCRIIENDSGLHLILEFVTNKTDKQMEEELAKQRIRICAVTDYDMRNQRRNLHQFILNYSNIDEDRLREVLLKLVL